MRPLLTHSLTHSLNHSLTQSLTHSLTHSLVAPEGRDLVILITHKVAACTEDFTAATIGKMIMGLKYFDGSTR